MLTAYIKNVENGTLNPQNFIDETLQKIQTAKDNAFVHLHHQHISRDREEQIKKPLHGAPIGIKDNMMLTGEITSCCSKMLETYKAPYTATCCQKLLDKGALLIGKTNMDEFAMGSSTEHSYF
ncbi:hypothetical protein J5893_05845 [bacterium]|nr:hypothetical protein [bacterium]